MKYHYHAGELEAQKRAGVRDTAERLAGSIHSSVPLIAQEFLAMQRLVVLATADRESRPWASLLSGAAGFAQAVDEHTVRIQATPSPEDPLASNLEVNSFVGVLIPDLAARRRLRINGRLESYTEDGIVIRVEQAYSNCPKYIQRREWSESAEAPPANAITARSASILSHQQDWIRLADTFFIASLNPDEGADASHRGGMPGFLTVHDQEITWPDYSGNTMFNTFGNLVKHARAGILIPDFNAGASLQMTGRVRMDWNPSRATAPAGAERIVHLTVEDIVESRGVLPRLRLMDYSPLNPSAAGTSSKGEYQHLENR